MAAVQSLRTHLVDELIDLRSAEEQLIKALPKLAESATSRSLGAAFRKHLEETRGHLERLDEALRVLGETPRSKTCEGMEGLLSEGESVMNKTSAGPLRDAVMITGAQKVEHYEMASYGTARTYAQVLGEATVARLLQQTLREEKAADRTLTQIAEQSINDKAAEAWQKEEGLLTRSAEWAGSAAGAATRQVASGVRRAAAVVGLAQDRPASGATKLARRSSSRRRSGSRRRTAGRKK